MAAAGRQDVIHEGWLTKSPPNKRVWKPKWRRRWFTLRKAKILPVQYVLDYYTDKNSSKLKGTINLDLCTQIDSGLQMPKRSKDESAPKGSVFSIKTTTRVYHLQADTVFDAQKWVDAICKACEMLPTTDEKFITQKAEIDSSEKNSPPNSSPYIHMSECITGSPSENYLQDKLGVYKNWPRGTVLNDFYQKKILGNIYGSSEKATPVVTYKKFVENGNVIEVFQRSLSISSHSNGPPPPPRPPKPSHLSIESHKDMFVGPRIHEPVESFPRQGSSNSKAYCNLQEGPTVDRNLKPRRLLELRLRPRNGEMNYSNQNTVKLQYIDLDLPSSSVIKTRIDSSPTNYKTVDFLKTEALSMTRAEACRRNEPPSAKVD